VTMTISDVIAAHSGHDGTVGAPDGPRAGRPQRRIFTAEYKLSVLDKYENAESPMERAALLRREGIYEGYSGHPVEVQADYPGLWKK
jgi:hypothetical protein